jgi:hypothetical protein
VRRGSCSQPQPSPPLGLPLGGRRLRFQQLGRGQHRVLLAVHDERERDAALTLAGRPRLLLAHDGLGGAHDCNITGLDRQSSPVTRGSMASAPGDVGDGALRGQIPAPAGRHRVRGLSDTKVITPPGLTLTHGVGCPPSSGRGPPVQIVVVKVLAAAPGQQAGSNRCL